MLALIGEQAHLVGLLLEHATQKGTFLFEAAALVLAFRALTIEHLAHEFELTG